MKKVTPKLTRFQKKVALSLKLTEVMILKKTWVERNAAMLKACENPDGMDSDDRKENRRTATDAFYMAYRALHAAQLEVKALVVDLVDSAPAEVREELSNYYRTITE